MRVNLNDTRPKINPVLFLKELLPIVEIIVQKSVDRDLHISISVVDEGGNLIFCYRMPDAILASVELSTKKAYTSVAMKNRTSNLQSLTQPDRTLYNLEAISGGKLVTFGGGVPINDKSGRLIGGVGISGAPLPDSDENLADLFVHLFCEKFLNLTFRESPDR